MGPIGKHRKCEYICEKKERYSQNLTHNDKNMVLIPFVLLSVLLATYLVNGKGSETVLWMITIWTIYRIFSWFKNKNKPKNSYPEYRFQSYPSGEQVESHHRHIWELKSKTIEANKRLLRIGYELDMQERYFNVHGPSSPYWTITNLKTGERWHSTKEEQVSEYCNKLFLVVSSNQKYQHIREVRKTHQVIDPIKITSEKALWRLYDCGFKPDDVLISQDITLWKLSDKKGRPYTFNNMNDLEEFSIRYENEKNALQNELKNDTQRKNQLINKLKGKFNHQIQKKGKSMFSDLADENRALIIVLKKYGKAAESYYTYSFQDPSEINFLFKAKTGHLMLGLIDKDVTFSVPISLFNASDIGDQEMRIDDLENVYTMKFAKQEIRINKFIL